MSVEHRRPLLAFLAVVALAITIVASNFSPARVADYAASKGVGPNTLAPDVLLGRALAVIPGRPTLSASPDNDRADRAAAGSTAAESVADRDDADDRAAGSAAGTLGVTLTRQQGTRDTAAVTTGSRPSAGVATPARPSTGGNGSGAGAGAGQAPPSSAQPVPAPSDARGNGVVRRTVRGVSGTVQDTGKKVGQVRKQAEKTVAATAGVVAGRLPSFAGPSADKGRGHAGRDRGRSSVAGPPGLVRREADRAVAGGRAPRTALPQRPVAHRTPKAARPAPVRSAATSVRHDSRPHQGHRAPTVDRAVVPRAPRVEVGRGHGPRHAVTRAPRQARPDHAPRPQRAAGPARGHSAKGGHGRH